MWDTIKKTKFFFREIALLLRLYCNASFLFQFHSLTLYGEYLQCIPTTFFRTTWVLKSGRFFRFPNDPCLANFDISLSEGICYTSEQCLERGGSSGGICANGFGVCCICNVRWRESWIFIIPTFFPSLQFVSVANQAVRKTAQFLLLTLLKSNNRLVISFLSCISKHVIWRVCINVCLYLSHLSNSVFMCHFSHIL